MCKMKRANKICPRNGLEKVKDVGRRITFYRLGIRMAITHPKMENDDIWFVCFYYLYPKIQPLARWIFLALIHQPVHYASSTSTALNIGVVLLCWLHILAKLKWYFRKIWSLLILCLGGGRRERCSRWGNWWWRFGWGHKFSNPTLHRIQRLSTVDQKFHPLPPVIKVEKEKESMLPLVHGSDLWAHKCVYESVKSTLKVVDVVGSRIIGWRRSACRRRNFNETNRFVRLHGYSPPPAAFAEVFTKMVLESRILVWC